MWNPITGFMSTEWAIILGVIALVSWFYIWWTD
jgi:hypothetical protein